MYSRRIKLNEVFELRMSGKLLTETPVCLKPQDTVTARVLVTVNSFDQMIAGFAQADETLVNVINSDVD